MHIFDSYDELKKYFFGFVTVQKLMVTQCDSVPGEKGIYCVVYKGDSPPEFLTESVGGHFKNKNPTVSIEELKANWVEGATVIYIGQAGGGTSKATLKSRLTQYMKFGQGKKIGHWGGRLIWQIKDHKDLVICWRVLPGKDPGEYESKLIQKFKEYYQDQRPFANLKD